VKRDDLTNAAYGGNKVRKLDFLLGDALGKGATTVLTFGAYGSNHALATAVHARALGLEPHVVLSPQEPGPFAEATLLAHARLGTHLHLTDGWDGSEVARRAVAEIIARDGAEPYVIPMGGSNALGAIGFVNAALEVDDSGLLPGLRPGTTAPAPPEPDVVYVAAGTLGTAVGLAIGFALAENPARVEAVRVTPADMASPEVARALAEDTLALLRSLDPGAPQPCFEDLQLSLREDWFEPGYGVPTPETEAAVAWADEVGIKLETTYTGKATAAMLADVRAGVLHDSHVLLWDTYSSAPKPAAGRVEDLPAALQEYVAECERLFGPPR
jgi:D-cysteine desulfhydrase